MPKNDDAFTQYVADLLSTVPDDQRESVERALKADTTSQKLREGVLARADYSRQSDELRNARKQFETEVAEARTRIEGWNDWYAKVSKETADALKKVEKYEATYGPMNDDTRRAALTPGLSKEDVTKLLNDEVGKMMAERDAQSLDLAVQMTRMQQEYYTTFKELLPVEEVIKLATERRVPLSVAYQSYIQPKRDELAEAKHKEALDKARLEGEQAAIAKFHLPAIPGPSTPHVLDSINKDPIDVPRASEDRIRAALSDFNEQMTQRPS